MQETATIYWGLLFGSIGFAFFIYGKKQRMAAPLICGPLLIILPYFISSTLLLVVGGLALIAIPFLIRR